MIVSLNSGNENITSENNCRQTKQSNHSLGKDTFKSFIQYLREHGIAFDWWEIQ